MSSLSLLLHVPNVSVSHSPKLCFSQSPAMPNHLAYPISITKDHRLRATIKESSTASDGNEKKIGSSRTEEFPEILKRELMPKHVAIFPDGNRRWGNKYGLSANFGYKVGTLALLEIVKLCARWGIPVISIFGSHVRTRERPEEENSYLMEMYQEVKSLAEPFFQREGVRYSMIGDASKLPSSVVEVKNEVEEATRHNSKTHFIFPTDYTGSYDIIQACKSISQKVKDGTIQPEDINEKLMGQELETKCEANFPEPDLIIRTGGHHRLSDYYLWQSAYSELYFTDALWPDFGKNEFIEALASFQERKRGYGRRL